MVDSSNKKLRAHLHAKLKAKHNDFDKQMVRLQMDTIVVHTDKSYIRPLMSFSKSSESLLAANTSPPCPNKYEYFCTSSLNASLAC